MKTMSRGRALGLSRWATAAVMIVAAGCADTVSDRSAELAGASPDEAFAALEEVLGGGTTPVRITFDVVAEGAVRADLFGTLLLGRSGRARIEAAGTFAGEQIDVTLISDGNRMFWTGGENGVPTPDMLRPALGIGFTRMGVLHNLARLVGGAPPDHADGGVREWVTVGTTDDRGMMEGAPEGAAAASVFRSITVSGQPAGAFALEFEEGRPTVRRQRVEFPQGIMRVTERYRVVDLGADFAEGAFDTTPLDTSR
ncbi:MAG TPA: hypothetical protein VJ925_12100 [Longimicrobiales bacterium]|nr:hypothetical protein [Longimicrobiales bacterium]